MPRITLDEMIRNARNGRGALSPGETRAARIIRKHYGLTRPVTGDETRAEIANLRRRANNGTLDDSSERLAAALRII